VIRQKPASPALPPLPEFGWVSAGILAPVVVLLSAEGLEVESVLRAGGVSRADLDDPTRRISIQAATAVWQAALRALPDPTFGLRAALLIEHGDADLLSCLSRACSTLEEALGLFARFGALLDETLECEMRREHDGVFFSFGRRSVHYLPAVAEYAALRLVLLGRSLLGGGYGLLGVRFAHRAPRSLKRHRELFGAPLEFEQGEVGLLLDPSTLVTPLPQADPVLKSVLVSAAERLLGAHRPTVGTAQRVRDVLVELLPQGPPSRKQVSERLGVSERTLSRLLESEGTHFKAIVEELRYELALRRLQDGREAIGDVAAALGFHDQSAFTKFFKRRAGTLPLDYRRKFGMQ
jgi:AraC-like DNA-binding protein